MKFLTLEKGQLGALVGDSCVDLAAAEGSSPATLLDLVKAGDDAAAAAWRVAQKAAAEGVASRPFDEVAPLAPIPRPARNIFCLGKNYRDHVRELGGQIDQSAAMPEAPIVFTKATTTVIGPGLIVGRDGSDIAPERAWEHVFGYTAINDVTARDVQKRHRQWFLGKSLSGFAPMGPVVVHRSAMLPAEELHVRSWVNGEARQDATFDLLIFDVPEIIATLSRGAALIAGDIIATGTPAGVGIGFKPPKFLKNGDEVIVEVTGAGRLANRVGDA
jgi:2-keto-4-pentenoate hydratase/2-oxohepta-3-ene-1,7-dioic acid hydratase in catechol pathway